MKITKIKITVDGYEVKEKPCCFLAENGACKIEKCKSEECREYPFTNSLDRLFSLLSIVSFASVCPVVFEMLERLKGIYGFRWRGRY